MLPENQALPGASEADYWSRERLLQCFKSADPLVVMKWKPRWMIWEFLVRAVKNARLHGVPLPNWIDAAAIRFLEEAQAGGPRLIPTQRMLRKFVKKEEKRQARRREEDAEWERRHGQPEEEQAPALQPPRKNVVQWGVAPVPEESADAEERGQYVYRQIYSTQTVYVFRSPDDGQYIGFQPTGEGSCLAAAAGIELAEAELVSNPILAGALAEQMPIIALTKLAEEHFNGRYVVLMDRRWVAEEPETGAAGDDTD